MYIAYLMQSPVYDKLGIHLQFELNPFLQNPESQLHVAFEASHFVQKHLIDSLNS